MWTLNVSIFCFLKFITLLFVLKKRRDIQSIRRRVSIGCGEGIMTPFDLAQGSYEMVSMLSEVNKSMFLYKGGLAVSVFLISRGLNQVTIAHL
jgi:hypothetical protein